MYWNRRSIMLASFSPHYPLIFIFPLALTLGLLYVFFNFLVIAFFVLTNGLGYIDYRHALFLRKCITHMCCIFLIFIISSTSYCQYTRELTSALHWASPVSLAPVSPPSQVLGISANIINSTSGGSCPCTTYHFGCLNPAHCTRFSCKFSTTM